MALLSDGRLLGEKRMETRLNHSAGLVAAIGELLAVCGCEREEVEGIGVDVGPGSFTGVRVGVASARGFARGLSAPLSGVTSLEALVSADTSGRRYLFPVIDARGGCFYGALFEKESGLGKRLTEIKLWRPGDLQESVRKDVYFFGPGLSAWKDEIVKQMGPVDMADSGDCFPTAAGIAMLAAGKMLEGRPSDPVPIYLKSYTAKH